jgi:hypothetical protein
LSGESGYSGRAVPTGSRVQLAEPVGAVTITPRSCERFAADVDGAAARDLQQPQRLAPLASPGERERVAGERGPRGPGRVQRVVFAAEPTLAARYATDLEHALSACMEIAAETGAVAAGALDRPGAAPGAYCSAKRSVSR